MKHNENFILQEESTFSGNLHFGYKKFVFRVQEETEDIQNLILF